MRNKKFMTVRMKFKGYDRLVEGLEGVTEKKQDIEKHWCLKLIKNTAIKLLNANLAEKISEKEFSGIHWREGVKC